MRTILALGFYAVLGGSIPPAKKRLRIRGKQNWLFFAVLSMFLPIGQPVAAGEINACKYLVVTDFSSDPYGIAKELRAQGTKKGFVVVSAIADVPQADLLTSASSRFPRCESVKPVFDAGVAQNWAQSPSVEKTAAPN